MPEYGFDLQTNIKCRNLVEVLEGFRNHAEAMGVAVDWFKQFWLEKFTQAPGLIDTIIQKDDLKLFFHHLEVMNVDKQAVLESLTSAFFKKDPRSLSTAESVNLVILLENMRNNDGVNWLEKWGLKEMADVTNGGQVYGTLSNDSRHGPESVFQRELSLHPKYWNPARQTSNKYFLRRELTAAAVPIIVAVRCAPRKFRILALGDGKEAGRVEGDQRTRLQELSSLEALCYVWAIIVGFFGFYFGFLGFYYESFFLLLAAFCSVASAILGILSLCFRSFYFTCSAVFLAICFGLRKVQKKVSLEIVFNEKENKKKLREMEEEEKKKRKKDGNWMTLLDANWVRLRGKINHEWNYWFIHSKDAVKVFKIVVDESEPSLIVQDVRIFSKE